MIVTLLRNECIIRPFLTIKSMINTNIIDSDLPKITIITPVKNSVKTMEKAIQSLISQNYPNLEYIILDGGSSDGTIDIIKKYENFINHWESKDDKGNVTAYIEGIKKSDSDIIGFLNSDDFYEPNVLLQAGQAFKKNPSLDLVSFRFRTLVNDNENYKIIEESQSSWMEIDHNKIIIAFAINARFFKRNLFFKYGFPQAQDEKGRPFLSNDLEYMIRFALKGIKNQVIDYVGYNYLSHNSSLTFAKNYKTTTNLWEDKIYIAKKFLNSTDIELPKIWRKTFEKWIKKYRALIVKNHLKNANFKEMLRNLDSGYKDNGFFNFNFYLLKTLLRKKN